MKWIALLTALIFLCSSAYAAEFKSYKIVAEVEGDTVNKDFVITLFNDAEIELKAATISAPLDSEIIFVRDSYGDLPYKIFRERNIKIIFNFTTPLKPKEERLLLVKLSTKSLVTKKEDYFEYLLVFTPKQDIADFEHVLKLPKDAKLYSPGGGFQMVIPEAELSKQYPTPTLVWKAQLKQNNPEVFLVRYKTEEGDALRKIGFSLALILVAGVLLFSLGKAKEKYQKRRTLESLKILNERERRVLEEIISSEGIKQYELLAKLEYTKSSLSKILARLEARGLIRKKKIGKVNRWYAGERL
ncbi:MAG: MarR family transcriptional regulator [Euryarchaeota archaeon]|nr:MarR family transcriptional regulator [Euryarchaeota archaeon]